MNVNVTTTLPAVAFDFAGLKAWAEGITEQYQGLVVQEDQVSAIKNEMAGLNKIKKQVDDARKEAVRRVSEPVRTFEQQVREITGIFDSSYRFLADQVNGYERRAREERRHAVQFIIDAAMDEAGVRGQFPLAIQDGWLNKTKSPQSIRAEVDSIILAHIKAEQGRVALERARKDRAVYIEEKCASLAKVYGFPLSPSSFLNLHDLSTPLEVVGGKIEDAFTDESRTRSATKEEARASAGSAMEAARVPGQTRAVPAPPDTAPSRRPPVARVARTITIEYFATREVEVSMALLNLEALCVSFES